MSTNKKDDRYDNVHKTRTFNCTLKFLGTGTTVQRQWQCRRPRMGREANVTANDKLFVPLTDNSTTAAS